MIIKEGDWVIIDENGTKRTFVRLQKLGQTIKIAQKNIPSGPIIGLHYGSVFRITPDTKSLVVLDRPVTTDLTRVTDTAKDNSSLLDLNTENQKLERDDIEAMKNSGQEGSDIIRALISNSSTFDAKTEFSQDKYIKKKTKKYISYVTAMFKKDPERVWNLSMAIALSYANVCAGSKVLVIDGCNGVVTASVLERLGGFGHVLVIDGCNGVVTASVVERLGGFGHVCCSYMEADRVLPQDVCKHLNLTLRQLAGMSGCSIETLEEVKAKPPPAACAEGEADPAKSDAAPMSEDQKNQLAKGSGVFGSRASEEVLATLVHPGFNSCIIAAPKIHYASLMARVMPLLRPSAFFVLLSNTTQNLAECMNGLQNTRQALNMQLQESWLRPYQVLPMRTHPMMMCDGTGGFIMSGIKTESQFGGPPGGHMKRMKQQQKDRNAEGSNKRVRY
eukprot:gene21707-28731_t